MRFVTILMLLAAGAAAQTTSDPTLDKNPLRGILPTATYAFSDIETINTQNGNVLMHIPIVSLPGGRGGLTASLNLIYNSKLYSAVATVNGVNAVCSDSSSFTTYTLNPADGGGWSYGYQYYVRVTSRDTHYNNSCAPSCPDPRQTQFYKYELIFPDGSAHPMLVQGQEINTDDQGYTIVAFNGQVRGNCGTGGGDATLVGSGGPISLYTTDGTYVRVDANVPSDCSVDHLLDCPAVQYPTYWTAHFPDGRTVTDDPTNGQTIRDRNGNSIYIQGYLLDLDGSVAAYIEDDFSRYIQVTADTVKAIGFNDAPLTWKISWSTFTPVGSQYIPYDPSTSFPPGAAIPQPASLPSVSAVTDILLPVQLDSLSYHFEYQLSQDASGNLFSAGYGPFFSATLPSSAKTTYTYLSAGYVSAVGTPTYQNVLDDAVSQKILCYSTLCDGANGLSNETWHYSIFPGSNYASITAPDGGVTQDSFSNGLSYKTVHPDGTTVEKTWKQNLTVPGLQNPAHPTVFQPVLANGGTQPGPIVNPIVFREFTSVPDQITTSGPPNLLQTAIKEYAVDSNGNQLSQTEYDWVSHSTLTLGSDNNYTSTGSASAVRTTTSSYATLASTTAGVCTQTGFYCHPQSSTLVFNALTMQKVSGVGKGSRTEYCYDNAAITANRITEAHWDSTVSGSSIDSTLLTCPSTVAAYGVSRSFTYETISGTDLLGNSYTSRVDGNVLTSTDFKGTVTQHTYGAITVPTDSLQTASTVSNLYPTQTVVAVGQPEQQTTTSVYDFTSGLATYTTDPNGVTTRTIFDDVGRPSLVIAALGNPDQRRMKFTYSMTNRYAMTQADVHTQDYAAVTIQHFDPLWRVRLTQQLESGSNPDLTTETAGIKTQVRYVYGPSGHYTLKSNPYRASSSANSEVTMGWTLSAIDVAGRPCATETFDTNMPTGSNPCTNPTTGSNGRSTIVYSADGTAAFTTTTDPAHSIRNAYQDGLQRMTHIVEHPDSSTTFDTYYAYDALDNLMAVCQGGVLSGTTCTGGQHRSFDSDSLKRLTDSKNPETGGDSTPLSYTYDANGNMLTKTDSRSVTTTVGYDHLNRVVSKNYSDGTTLGVGYCYDAPPAADQSCQSAQMGFIGRMTESLNANAVMQYTLFDSFGRAKASAQAMGSTSYPFTYSYDLAGNLTSMSLPSNRTESFSYDDLSRATNVLTEGAGETVQTVASGLSYTPHGALATLSFPNGVTETAAFNPRMQMTGLTAGSLLTLGYDYGSRSGTNNGNLLSQTITVGSWSATQNYPASAYDGLNRLTQAVETNASQVVNWQQVYAYDRYGNRALLAGLQYYLPEGSQSANVDSNSASSVEARFPSNRSDMCGFDAAGNALTCAGSTNSYVYDAENRVVSGGSAAFAYDGDGRRVSKTVGSTTTTYVYDASGTLTAEYGASAPNPNGNVEYLTADSLGSTRLVTGTGTANGGVISRHDYLPFGQELTADMGGRNAVFGYPTTSSFSADGVTHTDSITQEFTGKERDAETGLDYFGARYLSSAQGRFMSVDPLLSTLRPENPQTLNRYAYTLNNPLRYIDKTGAYEEDVHRDLTTVLALVAGFDEKTATAIGRADQGVDDDSKTGPFASEEARRDYHFTSAGRRQDLWNKFDSSGSTNDLGTFLHAEQDSFSHEGFGPKFGHLTAGHAPDKTYNDPGKADNMAKDTFQKLAAAADKLGISATNKVAFEKVDKLVSAFNKATTTDAKNKILGQIRDVVKQVQQEQQKQKQADQKP